MCSLFWPQDQPEQRDSTPSATPTSSVESNDAGISASSRHAGTVESSPTERQAPESGTLYTRGQQPLLLSENQPGASPLAQHQPPGSVLSPCKSIVVKEAEKLKLDFIRGSKTAWDEFVQKLSIVHAEPEFTDDSAILHSTLNAEVQGAHKLAATWTHDVQEAVTKYLRGIAIHKITVTDDIWQTLETSVKDAASDSAFVHPLREEKLFAVVGFSSNATSLYEHIMETLESLKQEAERKKDEITERNRKLNSAQLRILAAMSFDVEVDKRYEGVKVDIDLGQREIIFRGIRQDVNDAQVDMYELLNQVKSKHIANISDSQRELLVRIETRSFVEDRFKSKGFVAIWEISNQEVQVYAFNDKCVEDAARIIRESVQTHNINLSRESTELIRSSDWQGWMKILEDSHPGRFLITLSQNDSQIVLTATSDIIHEVKERVECYLEKNTVYRQTFRLSESRQRFVKLFNEASLQEIQEKLKPHKVAVSLSETGTEIWVQGRKEGLQLVKNELTKLEGTIQCKMETIVDPAHIKFLTSENSRQELEKLGSRNHCIVSLDPESSGLQVKTVFKF
ncbi:hypothetical protein BaRGS_00000960 [Batillaria attramentaria]|uniref:PARP14 second type I KH domain-containing protein n=1 Tax=Batillaria attramentaria TaxID=370345 RepID=A0ABD0M7T0_9CAEN